MEMIWEDASYFGMTGTEEEARYDRRGGINTFKEPQPDVMHKKIM